MANTNSGVADIGAGIRDGLIGGKMFRSPSSNQGAPSGSPGTEGPGANYGPGTGVGAGTLTPRQAKLDFYWRFYRCAHYDGRKFGWDGRPHADEIQTDLIATSGVIPPGFYGAGQTAPLAFRRPIAPFYLGRVIVNRFTNMLFSAKRHPSIACDDKQTEDWLEGFAEATRLWSRMIMARRFGGAMGAVGIGFKFIKGRPHIELFDPRWSIPEFEDDSLMNVKRFEFRYQFSEERTTEKGEKFLVWFWYRRLIDENQDIVWKKVPVDGNEQWERHHHEITTHGFGECPVVWIQNEPIEGLTDGDPDFFGIIDQIKDIDSLYSQASRSIKAACDPTMHVASDAEFEELETGAGKAIQTEKGGAVNYLEMHGAGIQKAFELAQLTQQNALLVAQVSLDRNEGGAPKSPEEIDHNFSSMVDQADILREQYGERGVKRLLEKVVRAAQKLESPKLEIDAEGNQRLVSYTVIVPKKAVKNERDQIVDWLPRTLGQGSQIELTWSDYFTAGITDIAARVTATVNAFKGGLIDLETAVKFLAKVFNVESVQKLVEKLEATQAAAIEAFGGKDAMLGKEGGKGPAKAAPGSVYTDNQAELHGGAPKGSMANGSASPGARPASRGMRKGGQGGQGGQGGPGGQP